MVLVVAGSSLGKPDVVVQFIGDRLAEPLGHSPVPLAIHVAVNRAPDLDKLHQTLLGEIGEVQVGDKVPGVVVELQ